MSSCFEQQLLISILLHKQQSFTRLFFLSSLLRFSSHLFCFYFYFIEFYFCFYCATHSKYYASFVIIGHWSASICYLLQKKTKTEREFSRIVYTTMNHRFTFSIIFFNKIKWKLHKKIKLCRMNKRIQREFNSFDIFNLLTASQNHLNVIVEQIILASNHHLHY